MSSHLFDDPKRQTASLTGHPERLQALSELWQDAKQDIWVTLRGGSMMPAICPGTRLRLRCDDEVPLLGTVIAFRRDAQLVVHRLRYVDDHGCLVCQGDANAAPDEPITRSMVLGVVVEAQPPNGWVRARHEVIHGARRLRNAAGRLRSAARTLGHSRSIKQGGSS